MPIGPADAHSLGRDTVLKPSDVSVFQKMILPDKNKECIVKYCQYGNGRIELYLYNVSTALAIHVFSLQICVCSQQTPEFCRNDCEDKGCFDWFSPSISCRADIHLEIADTQVSHFSRRNSTKLFVSCQKNSRLLLGI